MNEGQRYAFDESAAAGIAAADRLAARALAAVASRGLSAPRIDPRLIARLEAAVLSADPQAPKAVVASMLRQSIAAADIVDHYIPAAARSLGDRWCADTTSFAEVTVGSARLQSMLRDFGPDGAGEERFDRFAASILLIVQEDDHHTLGPMVAAAQMRRMGVSVRLALGMPVSAILDLLETRQFGAVFLAASASARLEPFRILAHKLRNMLEKAPPILLGGTILDQEGDAPAIVGADHATSLPEEALRLCGLRITPRIAMPRIEA